MPLKLLIADDEDMIRKGVAKYLQLHTDRFAKIYEAENGQEAIDLILRYQPDMLLLDVQMPVMDGYTATRQIRALENPALAGVPILAMTANAFDEDRRRAMESGMNGFLSKPIVIGDLVQELHKIL